MDGRKGSSGCGVDLGQGGVGTNDKIFPPHNQREAWQGVAVEEVDAEHYDEELFRELLNGESRLWTRP